MSFPAKNSLAETNSLTSEQQKNIEKSFLRIVIQTTGHSAAFILRKNPEGHFLETSRTGKIPPELITDSFLKTLTDLTSPKTTQIGSDWSSLALPLTSAAFSSDEDKLPYGFVIAFSALGNTVSACTPEVINDIVLCAQEILPPTNSLVSNIVNRAALPGRTESYSALETMTAQAKKNEKPVNFGLIKLNLSNLTLINERHGWENADIILDEVVQRLKQLLPDESFLGYLGGSHFMIMTPLGYSAINTKSLVNSILRLTVTPISIGAGQLPFTLSVGWAMFPADNQNAEELLLEARAALAESNRFGGGHDYRATKEITTRFQTFSSLEQDLSRAVKHDALFLTWMPIVETASQHIIGHEALLRWNRPGFGEVAPELFIQCAEEAGIIEQLDGWSLRTACKEATRWRNDLRVCVNVSPVWLVNERLSSLVAEVLKETGLAPERLQIELSECSPFGPPAIAHKEMARVRAMGVRIALDDFGRGYASLERLSNFPLDQIKLDRSFMQGLGENMRVDDIMRAVLRLTRSLNITCCAKGIETEYQMAFLDTYGCEEVQGYLLGAPVRDREIPPQSD